MTSVAVIGDGAQTRREMRDMAEAGHDVVWITEDERLEVSGVRKEVADLADIDSVAKRMTGAGFCVVHSDDPERIDELRGACGEAGAIALIASQRADVYERLSLSSDPAVFGVRWVPAVSSILAGLAAAEMKRVSAVRVSWLASVAGPLGGQMIHDLLAALSSAVVFEGGAWRRTIHSEVSEEVYLPEPTGWREVHRCAGVETLTLPRTIGVIDKVTVSCAATEKVTRLLSLLARTRSEDPSSLRARTAEGVSASLKSLVGKVSGRMGWATLRVDVASEEQSASFAVVEEIGQLQSATLLASLACLPDRRPEGLMTMEELVDPATFITALARRGIRIARLSR